MERLDSLVEILLDGSPGLSHRLGLGGGVVGVVVVDGPALLGLGGDVLEVGVALHEHGVADGLHGEGLGLVALHLLVFLDVVVAEILHGLDGIGNLVDGAEVVAIVLYIIVSLPVGHAGAVLVPLVVGSLVGR